MATIQPHYLTFGELLTNRLFRIPEYQRAYSWERRQREDLFEDIEKTLELDPDRQHFMATMVGLRRKSVLIGTDNHKIIEVFDGQQRLTTLIILLKSIELSMDDSSAAERRASEDLGTLLVKPTDGTLLLLQTNHDTTHIFRTYLTSGARPQRESARTISEKHLVAAIDECEGFVERWLQKYGQVMNLLDAIKNSLALILHETEDERSVYTVFEVLNSRGLEVSWFDRLKSMLMGAAFELKGIANEELINELRIVWSDIYSTIGLRQGMSTEALRFAATLKSPICPNRPLGEEDSVELFRSRAANAGSIRTTANWLLEVTKACDWVRSQTRLNAVTNIVHARLLLTAIRLRTDLSDQEQADLLALWEKVTFRIFGLYAHDARTRVGDYIRLAWSVINEGPSASDIRARLLAIGIEFPVERAVENLRGVDCYTDWQEVFGSPPEAFKRCFRSCRKANSSLSTALNCSGFPRRSR